MNFHIMTLFPDMVLSGLSESITGKAIEKGLIHVDAVNIRDFAGNKYGHVDDYTYGGGAGMLMQAAPVYDAYQSVIAGIRNRQRASEIEPGQDSADAESGSGKKVRVLYMTPQGQPFKQAMAEEYAKEEDLILLCGHYEGIDERVLEMIVTDYVSIGDFVLTGGELPAMMIVDAVSRLVPGVLGCDESAVYESFYDGLLEYPQYTRPEIFMGKQVPPVLLSGHHKNIEAWRHEQALIRTKERRPDLYEAYVKAHKE
ncbi:MAG: tRNA (guanosine(37)-N1)-methyltransferase TrmD [Wujia sp.]